MSVIVPASRTSGTEVSGNHERRIRALERRPPGTWVYAGAFPADPDTTPDSEPFQNSIVNAGGGKQRLRYRRTNENQTEFEGIISIPEGLDVAGTVIVTLTDPIYQPDEDITGPGIVDAKPCEWLFTSTGDLIFNGYTCCGDGGGGIEFDVENVGDSLHITAADDVVIGSTLIELDANVGGLVLVTLALGSALQVNDHLGNPILLLSEGVLSQLGFGNSSEVFDSSGITLALEAGKTYFLRDSAGQELVRVEETGHVAISLRSGKTFQLLDSLFSPMLEMTEGSPDLHIPSGGSVVADL